MARLPQSIARELPDLDSLTTLAAWSAGAAAVTRAMQAAVLLGTPDHVRNVRRFGATYRDLMAAWISAQQYQELEEELRELTAFVADIYAGRASLEDDGTKPDILNRPASSLAGGEGPQEKVH